jgi:hypothetical protein
MKHSKKKWMPKKAKLRQWRMKKSSAEVRKKEEKEKKVD